MVEVATPSTACFLLIYIFFEVKLMSSIDGLRNCWEDYILLFLFDVCLHVCMSKSKFIYLYMLVLVIH